MCLNSVLSNQMLHLFLISHIALKLSFLGLCVEINVAAFEVNILLT